MLNRRDFLMASSIGTTSLGFVKAATPQPVQTPPAEAARFIVGLPSLDRALPFGLEVGLHCIYACMNSGSTTLLRTIAKANEAYPQAMGLDLEGLAADLLVMGDNLKSVRMSYADALASSKDYVPLGGGYCGSDQHTISRAFSRIAREHNTAIVMVRRCNRIPTGYDADKYPSSFSLYSQTVIGITRGDRLEFHASLLKNRDGHRATTKVRLDPDWKIRPAMKMLRVATFKDVV